MNLSTFAIFWGFSPRSEAVSANDACNLLHLILEMLEVSADSAELGILTVPCEFCSRECTRGGFCNFMHLKPISRELRRELYGRRRKK